VGERTRVSAVPFALEADRAVVADNADVAATAAFAAVAATTETGGVDTAQIAAGAVETSKIAAGAVGFNQLSGGALVGVRTTLSDCTSGTIGGNLLTDCACAADEVAVGGGAFENGGGALRESRPLQDGENVHLAAGASPRQIWRSGCVDAAGVSKHCTATVALCARIAE
jgi:hypothetical protein